VKNFCNQAHGTRWRADASAFDLDQLTSLHGRILCRQARLLARFLRSVCFPALDARRIIARASGLRFLFGRFFIFYNHYIGTGEKSQAKKNNEIIELQTIF